MRRTKTDERPIDRLFAFADWCVDGKLCKSRRAFEIMCGMTNNYLYNTKTLTNGNLGVYAICKVHKVFPMLNITWIITGKGKMIDYVPDEGYRDAYNEIMRKVKEIKDIVDSIYVDTDMIPRR